MREALFQEFTRSLLLFEESFKPIWDKDANKPKGKKDDAKPPAEMFEQVDKQSTKIDG